MKNSRMTGFYTVLMTVAVILLCSASVFASSKSNTIGMDITNTGVLVKYTDTGKGKHGVVIPKEVSIISENAFAGCELITSIEFEAPDKIEEIGKGAFSGCTSLKKFTVPKKITRLEDNTFSGCKSLTEIKLSKKLTYIGSNCFNECHSLKKVELPSTVEFIGAAVFSNCKRLESIKLSKNLIFIGEQAFSGCVRLKLKALPNSVATVGAKAFQNCKSITEMTLYSNIGSYVVDGINYSGIGYDCFNSCSKLKKIVFKDRTAKLSDSKVLTLNNGDGIRRIPAGIFGNCESLKEVVIGNYFIEHIDTTAFNGCKGTITIKAPQWVLDKSIKEFVDNYRQNNVTLKYKAVK